MINTFYCIILSLLIQFSTVYACSCRESPSYDYGKFEASPIIYLGIISAIDTIAPTKENKFRSAKTKGAITVIERFKGDPGSKPIMIGSVMDSLRSNCDMPIPINTYMIIYQDEEGTTSISSCSRPELVQKSSPLISVYRYMGQQKPYDTLSVTFQQRNRYFGYKDTDIVSPFSYDAYVLRYFINRRTVSKKSSKEQIAKNKIFLEREKKSFVPFSSALDSLCNNRVCIAGSTEISVLFKGYTVTNGFFPLHHTVTASNISEEWISELEMYRRGPYKPMSESEEFDLYNPVYSYYMKQRFKFEKVYYTVDKFKKLLVYGYMPQKMLQRINSFHSYKESNPELGDYVMKRYVSP